MNTFKNPMMPLSAFIVTESIQNGKVGNEKIADEIIEKSMRHLLHVAFDQSIAFYWRDGEGLTYTATRYERLPLPMADKD